MGEVQKKKKSLLYSQFLDRRKTAQHVKAIMGKAQGCQEAKIKSKGKNKVSKGKVRQEGRAVSVW